MEDVHNAGSDTISMDETKNATLHQPEMNLTRPTGDTLHIQLTGSWTIGMKGPSASDVARAVESDPSIRHVTFDSREVTAWDSSLLTFLTKVIDHCKSQDIEAHQDGLPQGVIRLLALISSAPETKDGSRKAPEPLFSKVGKATLQYWSSAGEVLNFLGETTVAFMNLMRRKARFRRSDLVLFIQESGAQALPIVSLISLLVGLILAFVGAIQLRLFGAQIYVADLVGIGMAREMGAIMTGVIMAGRSGAAFAAQLGTMQVNEEIDALKTLGISPMEFLVLPRVLALVSMLPPLCLYADFIGILGGGIVGVGMLDLTAAQYYQQTISAVRLIDFLAGLFKSGVFGVLIALAGCLRGMQCGRSSAAVGIATTSAVVTGIVLIVVADAILTVLYDHLGI